MQIERQARTDENPNARKTDKLETLLRGIRRDARSLAETYPKHTVVPEGGE